MQLKFIKLLLKLLTIKPKLQHLVIVFTPLVILFRFNHLIDFSKTHQENFQENSISIGKSAHAAPDSATPPQGASAEAAAGASAPHAGDSSAAKAADKGFDPLTLDENQVRVLQAMAEAKGQKSSDADAEKQKQLIQLGKEKIAEQLAKLEKVKADLEKKKGSITKEETQNITQTAKIYENMKPLAAASIFNKMELVVLVQLIKHMNQKKASAIIAAMEPKKARYLTIELLRPDPLSPSP
ncbi:MotE family protein [Candidatus Paracaedibacter symbiosus]|uniref:MotE family protein n=1 Tax=Candidatus Paracaedibacter symbiosus TaxID=244582 RepID=UPI000509EB61|nr:hypothetical protein [Candidatus Paracaedibacter symbiosus]